MNSFEMMTTPETSHGARLCACSIRDGMFHDAIRGQWRPLVDDFGNVVGVRPGQAWDRAHHHGYGILYLIERQSAGTVQ